jgi:hypothetical protein
MTFITNLRRMYGSKDRWNTAHPLACHRCDNLGRRCSFLAASFRAATGPDGPGEVEGGSNSSKMPRARQPRQQEALSRLCRHCGIRFVNKRRQEGGPEIPSPPAPGRDPSRPPNPTGQKGQVASMPNRKWASKQKPRRARDKSGFNFCSQ